MGVSARFDLTGFNHKRPPESEALKAMLALSVNPHEEFAAGFIEDWPAADSTDTKLRWKMESGGINGSKKAVQSRVQARGCEVG